MKNLAFFAGIFFSFSAFSAGGPTNIGNINIGMSKGKYLSTIGITPINCNTFKDSDGKLNRFDMKQLTKDKKTLCWNSSFDKTGSTENIQVDGISYDVVDAYHESSKLVQSIGLRSRAIFLKDRLVSLEIYGPKVSLETLTTKYGPPKLADNTEVKICKNKIGNEFKNKAGEIDAIWTNGEVSAILRTKLMPPHNTCTDGIKHEVYILEERRQLELIESAINNFRNNIVKTTAKDSPF